MTCWFVSAAIDTGNLPHEPMSHDRLVARETPRSYLQHVGRRRNSAGRKLSSKKARKDAHFRYSQNSLLHMELLRETPLLVQL
jgi:hypothetical protein